MGYRVIPIHGIINGYCTCGTIGHEQGHKPGKHPACAHGCKDGTLDETTIRDWFANDWLNIGFALDSNHLGLDVDPAKGGSETIEAWEQEYGQLPLTSSFPEILPHLPGRA
jgi:hypothetical protein